jgi:2-phospho-L-lactate guanylyltransferase
MGFAVTTWVIVLIKDFGSAKQRLQPALEPKSREELARRNARLAVHAAAAGDHVLVVAGSETVASIAKEWGAEVLLEPRQEGQNAAAQRGITRALTAGADAVLLLSSDLPLVTIEAVRSVLDAASALDGPVAVAVPAIGRGGTNALYLRPPDAIALHFGDDSLAMALDLDEPADLARLRTAV